MFRIVATADLRRVAARVAARAASEGRAAAMMKRSISREQVLGALLWLAALGFCAAMIADVFR